MYQQYSGQNQFMGQPSMMQSGFSGTNPQQVRQEIAQDTRGGYQQGMMGYGQQFSNPMMHSGFGGTNMGMNQGFQQGGMTHQMGHIGGQSFGTHPMMQPGFAGTDVQHVRQQNMNSAHGGYGQSVMHSGFGGSNMGMGQGFQQSHIPQMSSFGTHSIMQPGFAGTDVQHVREQNMQSAQGGYGQMYNTGMMQTGFSGMNPQTTYRNQ